MARVLIFLIVLGAIIMVAMTLRRAVLFARSSTEDQHLPKSVQTLSYVLLIALMFGVVTGWLGGL
ncbi:hypothetical protein [Pseudooctadecabacter sp.]|uniref:hypothetical protein n=1 Tax=Pseudooctadecabacter sp. TaxID=1966338 RepID=UPI0025EB3386|nr:hypothetical protein [Pseudooctadecabacter sp.]